MKQKFNPLLVEEIQKFGEDKDIDINNPSKYDDTILEGVTTIEDALDKILNSIGGTAQPGGSGSLPIIGAVVGEYEIIEVTEPILANVAYTFYLKNSIADRQITVTSGSNITIDNIEDIMGDNVVTITPPFEISIGETIEVTYHRGSASYSGSQVTLSDLTGLVDANGNIVITYEITNADTVAKTLSLGQSLTDGGSNSVAQTVSYIAPAGVSTVSYTFPGLPAGTYDYTASGDLVGSVNDLVIPAKVADFLYSNFRTVVSGKNVTAYADVKNIGSASGSTHVHFYKDATSTQVNTPTLGINEVKTVSVTYPSLADATYTFKGYEDDDATQIGSDSVVVISTAAPIEMPLTNCQGYISYSWGGYGSWYNKDIIAGNSGGYFSWVYIDTSAIVGTVTAASLIMRNTTAYAWSVGLPFTITASAYTIMPSAARLEYDVSGTLYHNGAGTAINSRAVDYALSAAAVTKINLKNGLYLAIHCYDSGVIGGTFNLCTLKLTY